MVDAPKETVTPQGLFDNGLPVKTTGSSPKTLKPKNVSKWKRYLNAMYGKDSNDVQAFKEDSKQVLGDQE